MSKTKPKASVYPLNPTGMHPVEYKCLVRLDPVDEFVGASKTIIAPDIDRDRRQQAETFATLVEIGGRAFEDFGEGAPKLGDRVLVEAYAGAPPKKGDFENLYRFCNDKDIIAVIDQ